MQEEVLMAEVALGDKHMHQRFLVKLSEDEEGYLLGIATTCGRNCHSQVVLALPDCGGERSCGHHGDIRDLLIKSSWLGKSEQCLWVKNGPCGLHYLAAPELVQMAKWYGVTEDSVMMQQERLWDKQHNTLLTSHGTPYSILVMSRAFQKGYTSQAEAAVGRPSHEQPHGQSAVP
jgi:hypothetical protein